MSFPLTSLAFGMQEAIELKFELVRDFLSTGNNGRVDDIAEKIADSLGDIVF